MADVVQSFVDEPTQEGFNNLRKAELVEVAQILEIPIKTSDRKTEIKDTISEFFTNTGIWPASLSEDEAGTNDGEITTPLGKDPEIVRLAQSLVPEDEEVNETVKFYKRDGILMRRWRPPDATSDEDFRDIHQVVVPKMYRKEIISLAHEAPLAGHLGINKTQEKVLRYFFWPGLRHDVAEFCRSCHVCQVVGKPNQKIPPAPLRPIPAFEEPFSRVIVDCVGPLPRTKSGNQYLLTMMCASTRFPEAIPLRTITAKNVCKALVKFFTMVGLPKCVQSDQGSNFTSKIFQQVMSELGVECRNSSAYHPQSQGALERFHQTLKNMMRVYCSEHEKEWDEGIPLLLFAVRESVQESLGFSPFELVFGHSVRGPLKILQEKILVEPESNLLDYVCQFKDRLSCTRELAAGHLKAAQSNMKRLFDRKVKERHFEPGSKVLVLLPLQGDALKARYAGPYVVEKRPVEAKVETILNFPRPQSKRELRRFLGMTGYYRKFCHNFADAATPLTNMLRKDSQFEWSDDCQVAFNRLKAMLASSPVLAAPNFDKQFILMVDAKIPPVRLLDGLSPMDGSVVMESNSQMCYYDFNLKAADLVCRELGFPTAKDYSVDPISSAETSNRTQGFSYSADCQKARLHDCLSKGAECPWNKAVRLRCRQPGFLGCYLGDRHTFQGLHMSVFNVPSDEKCVSICRRKPENHDIAIVIEKDCGCYRSQEYANFISSVSYTHYWTRETEAESDQQVHCLYNLSVGFCEHPGPVSNGYWDSNITSFGSKLTLTCDEGFMLNGSTTLQCVVLSGWSTYFPAWNASVPSCRAVDNATNDNESHDPEIFTTSSQIAVFTSSEMQPTEELTSLQKTDNMTSSESGHHEIDSMVGLYTLGTFLFVVLTLLVILSAAWYKHHKKRKHRHPENSNKSGTHSLHSINTDAMHRTLPEQQGNKTDEVTANQEEVHHIYQNSAEDHTLEGEVVNNLPDTISRPLRDDLHRDSEDIAQCQKMKINAKKELYVDMTGNVKKTEDDKLLKYSDFLATENDIDENGYLMSNVSPHRPTSCEQEKTCYINCVQSFGPEINRDMPIRFRPADNGGRCEFTERSVYEDILSTSDQSEPIRELLHGHEYASVERNDKRNPLSIGLNNSLYSVTVYSRKPREERELDENGYLVLEACANEIIENQYANMDKEEPTTASLYEDMVFPKSKSP
ncbi:uncharacterized protein [Diadema setosum]|uniref:uncharacterized protein n=1 Tax=Diadema setosum TaxID=31175 RepID=UPI003B3B0169